ncbi:MAG: HDOD domain-containing protein [Pseudomonadales bacterium]|nr:HDOD domain-containing protein [Pseudomonadales bacterium]
MVNVINREKALLSLREYSDQKAGVRRLLSLPSLQYHVLRACNDPQKSHDQITNLVKYDPTLVAKILALNSNVKADPSLKKRISDTPRDSIKQLVLSGCAERYALYQGARKEVFAFLKQQWIIALQTAYLSRAFAHQFGYHKPEQAFYTGLIHNIGKSLFQSEDIDDYFALQQNATNENDLLMLESEQYGFNHCELGSYLAHQWRLDTAIQDAIRYHHTDIDKIQDAHPLTRIVFLARFIAEEPISSFKELILFTRRIFKVEHEELVPLVESALTQVGDVIKALNINVPKNLVSQSLVPFLPEESSHAQLQEAAKNHQLMREIHICGVIDAADISLARASTEAELQQSVNYSAKALYGVSRCVFFSYDSKHKTLQGKDLISPNCLGNEIKINLNNEHSLLTKCYRSQEICDTFTTDFEDLCVIDKEIIDHTKSNGMVCAPLLAPSLQSEASRSWADTSIPWGVVVFGFEGESDFQTAPIHTSMRYFSQKIACHLDRIEALQSTISQVQETEKGLHLAMLKRMVHEINNPLSIAQNNIHILGVRHQKDPEVTDSLYSIQEQITQAANLLKRHLDSSIDERPMHRAVNINELISDMLLIFQEGFLDSQDIVCELELDQTIPAVYIDDDAIKQILTNLIKNAAESMQDGGWLGLKTCDQVVIDAKEYIEIQVIDDGPGVPKTVVDKLFSPLESSKGIGHAGLGLSIVKDLANTMEGFVSYRRTPKGQTVFSAYLPRLTEPPEHEHKKTS